MRPDVSSYSGSFHGLAKGAMKLEKRRKIASRQQHNRPLFRYYGANATSALSDLPPSAKA
jgi:hypothetical protein